MKPIFETLFKSVREVFVCLFVYLFVCCFDFQMILQLTHLRPLIFSNRNQSVSVLSLQGTLTLGIIHLFVREMFRKTNIFYPLLVLFRFGNVISWVFQKCPKVESFFRKIITLLNLTQGLFIQSVRKILRKTIISYPLIQTIKCAYQGVRNVSFLENFAQVPHE